MIVIYENENFIGLFHNKVEDKFLQNTINALGLISENVIAYNFTSDCSKICKYEREEDKFYDIIGGSLSLKTIQVQAEYEDRRIFPYDLNALEYYSQEFIDNFNANIVAENTYLETNDTLENFIPPNSNATADKLLSGQALIVPPVIITDEVIEGVEIDITAKLLAENN